MRRSWRRRRARRARGSSLAALGVVAGLLGLTACSDDPERLAGDGDTLVQVEDPSASTAPAATGAATSVASSEVADTAPPTTEEIEPVDGCVDYLTFQIEAGDADAVELYRELGETAAALRDECERLAVEDPAQVEDMIEQKRAIDDFLAAAAADTTDAPTTTE